MRDEDIALNVEPGENIVVDASKPTGLLTTGDTKVGKVYVLQLVFYIHG